MKVGPRKQRRPAAGSSGGAQPQLATAAGKNAKPKMIYRTDYMAVLSSHKTKNCRRAGAHAKGECPCYHEGHATVPNEEGRRNPLR